MTPFRWVGWDGRGGDGGGFGESVEEGAAPAIGVDVRDEERECLLAAEVCSEFVVGMAVEDGEGEA